MRVDFPFLVEDPDRHGNERYYVRIKGKKTRIRAKYGTEAFTEEYWNARKGLGRPELVTRKARPGTLRWLVDSYMESPAFKKLDATHTQALRSRVLGNLVKAAGEKAMYIEPRAIRKGVKRRGYGAAKDFLTTLRGLYKWAFDEEFVPNDPTAGVHLTRQTTDGFHSWTAEDCAAFEKKWPLGTQARTAYAIGLYTAQRPSDAIKMGQRMVEGDRIKFRQWKNRANKPVDVDLPILPPLKAALKAWQGKGFTWLETEAGEKWSPDGFRERFKKWATAAGVPHCTFHGLRKATAAKMAENGCTPHQIMSVLGHSTHQQAATYTAKANRAKMADAALASLFGSVSPSAKVRQKRGKTGVKSNAA